MCTRTSGFRDDDEDGCRGEERTLLEVTEPVCGSDFAQVALGHGPAGDPGKTEDLVRLGGVPKHAGDGESDGRLEACLLDQPAQPATDRRVTDGVVDDVRPVGPHDVWLWIVDDECVV